MRGVHKCEVEQPGILLAEAETVPEVGEAGVVGAYGGVADHCSRFGQGSLGVLQQGAGVVCLYRDLIPVPEGPVFCFGAYACIWNPGLRAGLGYWSQDPHLPLAMGVCFPGIAVGIASHID